MLKIARFVGCWFLVLFFFFCIYIYSSENAMLCYCVCCDYNGIAYIPSLLQRKGELQTKVRKMAGNKPFFFYLLQKKKKIHSFTVEFYQLVFWRYYYPVNIQVKAELDAFYSPSCNHKITYGYKYGYVIWITHPKKELCIKQKIHFSGVVFASPFLALPSAFIIDHWKIHKNSPHRNHN